MRNTFSLARIVKAMVLAYGLTLANIGPLFLLHFLAPPIAPIIGGYIAGERYLLDGAESLALGALAAAVVGLPLPLVYDVFHLWGEMAPLFIGFISIFAAVYRGVIIGGLAYTGGAARDKAAKALAE